MRTLITLSALLLSSVALAEPPNAERPTPTASQEQIYRAFSVRDPVPSCETVEAMSQTPVVDLLFVVDHAAQPPWAAMRAAQCLVRRHSTEVQTQIEAWVSTEATKGLALMTLSLIDELPAEVALSVAQKALAGPLANDARPRIAKATDPELQKLAR
jgi:hypothetical protein